MSQFPTIFPTFTDFDGNQSFSMPLKGTAATAVNVQLGTAVTDVRVSANGYLGI